MDKRSSAGKGKSRSLSPRKTVASSGEVSPRTGITRSSTGNLRMPPSSVGNTRRRSLSHPRSQSPVDLPSQDIPSENLAQENRAPQDLPLEDMDTEDMAPEYIASEDMDTEDMAPEYMASEYMAIENMATENMAAEDMVTENMNPEAQAPEDIVIAFFLSADGTSVIQHQVNGWVMYNPSQFNFALPDGYQLVGFYSFPVEVQNVENSVLYHNENAQYDNN